MRKLDGTGVKDWRKSQQQQAIHTFVCVELQNYKLEEVRNTVLAEVAARKLANASPAIALVNFPNSIFNKAHIAILRYKNIQDKPELATIDCLNDLYATRLYLQVHLTIEEEATRKRLLSSYNKHPQLKTFDWNKWEPSFDEREKELIKLFPCWGISQELEEDWGIYYQKMNRLNTTERIGPYEKTAYQIASINGWIKNTPLSHKNQRTIYCCRNGSKVLFLGLDTQHGEFEIHDKRGEHLGAVNFKGEFKKAVGNRSISV